MRLGAGLGGLGWCMGLGLVCCASLVGEWK